MSLFIPKAFNNIALGYTCSSNVRILMDSSRNMGIVLNEKVKLIEWIILGFKLKYIQYNYKGNNGIIHQLFDIYLFELFDWFKQIQMHPVKINCKFISFYQLE